MITALIFFIILSLLILVHEGGHFLAARRAGVLVEEFGFGLPPRILGKKIGETIYSLNALPFGGFVRLYGEEEVVGRNKKRAFSHQSPPVRIGILSAGVVMNLLLGAIAFCLVYSFLGIPEKANQVKVEAVLPNSPGQEAGLRGGDIVDRFNGHKVKDNKTFINLTNQFLGKQVRLDIIRKGGKERASVTVIPRATPPKDEGPLGIVISDTKVQFYPIYWLIPRAIYSGFLEAFYWTKEIVVSLWNLAVSVLMGRGTMKMDIAGPIGIYQITGEVAKTGIWSLAQLVGILSINLAVLNIIPFPALDGGRVAFVLSEKFIGKAKRQRIEGWANRLGMAVLLVFILLVTINDVRRMGVK